MNDGFSPLANFVILGDQQVLRDMARGFQGQQAELSRQKFLPAAIVLVSLVLAIVFLSRYSAWRARRRTLARPGALFDDLCRVHQLDRARRKLLVRLAARWQLKSPALLFVEVERFDPNRVPAELAAQHANLAELRRILFGVATS